MVSAVVVRIHDGPLPAKAASCFQEGAGAAVAFEGLVRPIEDGRIIVALDYEVYEPMALRVLEDLARDMLQTHGLVGIAVEHSRGRVQPGECSFRLQIAARHRQEALAGMAEFIDRMKRDAPIWKNACLSRTLAAILAGGLSTRLGGTVKGLLPTPQGTIVHRIIAELAAATIGDIIIVTNDPQPYVALGRTIIGDLRPRVGPLGGIEAALSHARDAYDAVLLLPCDLPNISATEIQDLMAAFRARFASRCGGGHVGWPATSAVRRCAGSRAAASRAIHRSRRVRRGPALDRSRDHCGAGRRSRQTPQHQYAGRPNPGAVNMNELTHLDDQGRARMVDVGTKKPQHRIARAMGTIRLLPATCEQIRTNAIAKGNVLTVAQIAGIQAAKRTGELIPLCHPLGLDHVDVTLELGDAGLTATGAASCTGRTGVEMEALTAVSVALLTVYDMCKAVDKQMSIGPIVLLEKVKFDDAG